MNLPEHTSQSAKIAASEAVRRGLSPAEPDPEWLPPADKATLHPALPSISLADYERQNFSTPHFR